uniref:Uncharacterized protein n=1 Tax=Astyanax mexicanus TaxID=7994 RepID=A0A8B9K7K0_ASTMX
TDRLISAGIHEVSTLDECDIILLFLPIVSRAGTNINEALDKLDEISVYKPAVLVVLHCTMDPEKVVLDSSKLVNRENTLTVDCLFHEDKGLLKCCKNEDAVKTVKEQLKVQVQNVKSGFLLLTSVNITVLKIHLHISLVLRWWCSIDKL